jgi:hypothetical protein
MTHFRADVQMAGPDYWLAKIAGGWVVENRIEVFGLYATKAEAAARMASLLSLPVCPLAAKATPSAPLPDMPITDTFFRRFS